MLNPLWGFCTSKQAPTQTPAPSESFNPLWDFYSSKPAKHSQKSRCTKCFNPLWGFYSSKQCMVSSLTTMLYVSIPFGVSTLPNSHGLNLSKNQLLFQSPLGFLLFQAIIKSYALYVKYFCFNPLWGFYSSKLHLCNPSIYAG